MTLCRGGTSAQEHPQCSSVHMQCDNSPTSQALTNSHIKQLESAKARLKLPTLPVRWEVTPEASAD